MKSLMKPLLAAVLCSIALTSGCGYNNVPPGYAGIVVEFYGGDKGVDEIPVVTGVQWYNPWLKTVLEYPTFTQTATWENQEEMVFGSSEGLRFSGDVSLSYELLADKVPAFYVKFRSDDLYTFTHGYMRNVAREAFSDIAARYTAEELYSTKTEEFRKLVQERVNNQVQPYGVVVTQFGIIGRLKPPDVIADRINAKVGAIQKAQQAENELRERQAEAAKRVADAKGDAESQITRARGEAEANAILSASITPSLIAWREIQVKQNFVDRWNGAAPGFLSLGGKGELPTPIFDMR